MEADASEPRGFKNWSPGYSFEVDSPFESRQMVPVLIEPGDGQTPGDSQVVQNTGVASLLLVEAAMR